MCPYWYGERDSWYGTTHPSSRRFWATIDPHRPLLGLNGSYIIASYECREKETGILFFYNVYRDEYYGELRAKGIPGIIHQYDAKTIPDLEETIRNHLEKDLKDLYENPEIPD